MTRNSDEIVFKVVKESYSIQISYKPKSKSCTGYDMISNKLNQLIWDELFKPLNLIINQVLSSWIFYDY